MHLFIYFWHRWVSLLWWAFSSCSVWTSHLVKFSLYIVAHWLVTDMENACILIGFSFFFFAMEWFSALSYLYFMVLDFILAPRTEKY